MNKKWVMVIFAAGLISGHVLFAADDLPVADFTAEVWPAGWTVDGLCFGSPLPTANSRLRTPPYEATMQWQMGEMRSPEFKIVREYINIEVSGVKCPGKCYISLIVDGKEVRRITEMDMNAKKWRTMDVKELKGKMARIEVQDKYNEGWVDIDFVLQSDVPKFHPVVTVVHVWVEEVFESIIADKK